MHDHRILITAAVHTSREMLAKLVAFLTVSDRSNLDLITFVEQYLAAP